MNQILDAVDRQDGSYEHEKNIKVLTRKKGIHGKPSLKARNKIKY